MKNLLIFLALSCGITASVVAQNAPAQEGSKKEMAPSQSNMQMNTMRRGNYRHGNQNLAAKEKVQSMKIGYITQELNLTTSEAQAFWPVYNEYDAEMKKLHKSIRMDIKDTQMNFNTMSDSELNTMMDSLVAQKSKEAELFKIYHERFKKILPIRKVALLYRAENNFKRQLIDSLGN